MTRQTLFATCMALAPLAGVTAAAAPTHAAEFTTVYKFPTPLKEGGVEGTLAVLDNILYGTTETGGTGPESDGTIFKFDLASKTETTLVNFTGTSGTALGQGPTGPLSVVGHSIYGSTIVGGFGDGEIWKLNALSGKEQVFHGFNGTDGFLPIAGVTPVKGVFYGTTDDGGPGNTGTVFKLDATGKLTTLYTFPDTTIGCNPTSNVVVVGKMLYGTTEACGAGAGSVFSLNLVNKEVKALHLFTPNEQQGGDAVAIIVQNGALYGTTANDGNSGTGTFYKIDLANQQFKLLHQFGAAGDGAFPVSTLTPFNGLVYGATFRGGASGNGTIYSIDLATGSEAVIYSFTGGADGDSPDAGLLAYKGALYGSTENMNSDDQGTIFKLVP